MTFGIIGAMEEEVIYIKEKMEVLSSRNVAGIQFFIGRMHGKNIVIARCGIGKVNAAVCTQIMVDMFGVDSVINTGVAGSMNNDVHLGDVVISTDLVQHDFDTSAFENEPIGFIPRLGIRFFEADKQLVDTALQSAGAVLSPSGAKAHKGRIASGDQFITENELKAKIAKNFKPLCVEMEGAAIAHTCYLNDMPFIVIRSISDNSDGDTKTYGDYLTVAAKNSSDIVEKIVSSYTPL
ncbi:5'-methylthioadenosine/adenosylhomocysteine nucleosidase [Tyzzerella sp. OttesenSCG-928-J15]|nr:5'-methylthioadenosine/adenosylhomocysteine nucleosidase [Tyzzerella sp. OttesenSCG-928-J15]